MRWFIMTVWVRSFYLDFEKLSLHYATPFSVEPKQTYLLPPFCLCTNFSLFHISHLDTFLQTQNTTMKTKSKNKVTMLSFTLQNWKSQILNPQAPDGVYKPPLVYCRMGFINTSPFPALHLSRNAAKMSESLKISDQRMAKLYWAIFIHKQPLEGFPNLVMPPLASLSPLFRADFQGVASSRKMETKGK